MSEAAPSEPTFSIEDVEDVTANTALVTVVTDDGRRIGYFMPSRSIFERNGSANGNGRENGRSESGSPSGSEDHGAPTAL